MRSVNDLNLLDELLENLLRLEDVSSYSGINCKQDELMQNRFPVGCGPSGKTCPRWAVQEAQVTSTLCMP